MAGVASRAPRLGRTSVEDRPSRVGWSVLVLALVAGLTACGVPGASPQPSPSSTGGLTEEQWASDLAFLDEEVRAHHPGPFTNHPESEWTAKLAELPARLAGATSEQQLVRLAEIVGLLDTHTFLSRPSDLHGYEVVVYPFSDGWYVIRAKDPSLVGSRLVSIGGTATEDIDAMLRPLNPSDNESGDLDGIEWPIVSVEWLVGLGIVADPAKPAFEFELADGSAETVDLPFVTQAAWEGNFGIIGDLVGDAPEAVARRGEAAWTRIDAATGTFILSMNDFEDVLLPEAVSEMRAALDDGSATRVVVDLRYLRGGQGGFAQPLIDALSRDSRVNKPGSLVILIGRENVSAATYMIAQLDGITEAVFVGEPTPARADNFLCDCRQIALPYSGFVVEIPTLTPGTGDTRDAIRPDIPMSLSSADFFAGKDPVLDAVLAGTGFTAP